MSDYNSSLPVRTESDGDLVVKVADATTPSQQLKVESDGSINVNSTISATDLDIRDLDASQDNVAISDGTDQLEINGDGSINAVVTATDLDIRDLVFATDKVDVSGSSVTVSATNLDIRDLVFATDKVDVSGSDVTATVSATDLDIRDLSASQDNVAISDGTDTLEINGDGSINAVVSATDLDIRDLTHVSDSVKIGDGTDFLAVNANGSINVVVTDSSGTEVQDFKQASSVAAGATDNHDYTSVGGFTLTQVEASASSKARMELQIEDGVATDSFDTIAVQFNSTANPNMTFVLSQPILVATGVRVRVIMTNRDNQAQDLYSTILGNEA